MSRFKQYFYSPYTPQQINDFFCSYMQGQGFELTNKDGEACWKKGMGLLTAPQFIKLYQQNGAYVLEGWLKFALLPIVYVGEMGTDGFIGAIPKAMLRDRLNNILASLKAQYVQPQMGGPNTPYMQPTQQNVNGNSPQNFQQK